MIRRLKYWLLKRLVDDVSDKLIKRRGCVYLADLKACVQMNYLALYAWNLTAEDKEKENEDR